MRLSYTANPNRLLLGLYSPDSERPFHYQAFSRETGKLVSTPSAFSVGVSSLFGWDGGESKVLHSDLSMTDQRGNLMGAPSLMGAQALRILASKFSEDGHIACAVSVEEELLCFDLSVMGRQKLLWRQEMPPSLYLDMYIANDARYVLVLTMNGYLWKYELDSGKVIAKSFLQLGAVAMAGVFLGGDSVVVQVDYGDALGYFRVNEETNKWQQVASCGVVPDRVDKLTISSNGTFLVAGSQKGFILICDNRTSKKIFAGPIAASDQILVTENRELYTASPTGLLQKWKF